MSAPTILVIEDDPTASEALCELLREQSYHVDAASTAEAGLARFEQGVDAVLLDYRLPDLDGFTVLRRMRATNPSCPIMMMTGHAGIEHAVEAMQLGSTHYMPKPLPFDSVARWVGDVVRRSDEAEADAPSFEHIVGRSPAMHNVRSLLQRIARSPAATVLLTGESGTGKGLAAQALHAASNRADQPFMNITCTALTSTLLESELFGHERGAFTDAKVRKQGLLELAGGGTVFLDEIGDMTPELQSKLLRVLEERSFRRVGGSEDLRMDARVVAATHVDLHGAIADRSFREDLYYRLAVFVVSIPPLRNRPEDIDVLVQRFVADFSEQKGVSPPRITPEAMAMLRAHPWPGNVRELRNVLERAVFLGETDVLSVESFDLSPDRRKAASVAETGPDLPARGLDLRRFEQRMVEQALARTGGNVTRAAQLLGYTRDQMRYRIEKFGIGRP